MRAAHFSTSAFYLAGFIAMMATGQRRQRLGNLAAKTMTLRALPGGRWSLVLPAVALLLLVIVALSVYRATDSGGEDDSRAPQRATPLRAGAILIRDDFSNPRSGWPVDRDPSSSAAYVNGRYRISVRESEYIVSYSHDLDRSADAIRITVLLRQTAGGRGFEFGDEDEFGVICVSGKPIVGYTLGIRPTDRHGVGVLQAIDGGEMVYVFAVGNEDGAVKPAGKLNRLRADCIGTRGPTKPARLALYVNGKPIVRGSVGPGYVGYKRFNGVGFYSSSDTGGSTVLFDDVVVRELELGSRN
jgi:hypothetical protein